MTVLHSKRRKYKLIWFCADVDLGEEWQDDQQLPLETLTDFPQGKNIGNDGEENSRDPTIAQLPTEARSNPHKKTALELVLR